MRLSFVPLAALALAACSTEPGGEQESADDFASRIGQQEGAVSSNPSQADPEAPNTANESAPEGADLTQLQQLGDIGGVDLGPRDGGCTLMVGNQEMLVAAGQNAMGLPGKAVVRLGDGLVVADAPPGGLEKIRSGTTFTGEGFTVQVAPAAGTDRSRPANVVVTDGAGNSQNYSGNWICA